MGQVLMALVAVCVMVLGAVGLVCWPFVVIMSLNHLFGFAILYSFENWIAMLALIVTLRASVSVSRGK